MADNTNTESKDSNKETVGNDMRGRRTFYPERDDSGAVTKTALEQAQEYLNACTERFSDFDEYDFAAPGVSADDDGNAVFDSDIYADSVGIMVGKVTRAKEGVIATFMAPIPDFPGLVGEGIEDEAFVKWSVSILEKEANHVAVRPLRQAEDIESAVSNMPTSVDAYTTSGRGLGAGIMTAFNELYKAIDVTLSSKVPVWSKARLIKSDMKRAMESKGYALEYFPALEDRPARSNGESGSLFVIACEMGVNAAKKKGLDPTIFERFLATRDQKAFAAPETDDDEDFDLDSLTDDLLAEDSDEDEGSGDTDEDSPTSE